MPPKDPQAPAAPKLTRSRNGCVECRRLHRRCDEEKPSCANCRDAGKVCSYQKPLSWGGRPFNRSTFRHALGGGVVEIPIADSDDDTTHRRSFVYGQAESSSSAARRASSIKTEPELHTMGPLPIIEPLERSRSSPAGDLSIPAAAWLPWLSNHHRALFQHFIDHTVTIFTGDAAVQQEIRAAIVPMAIDTNHGFSLVAAILSLASTHRMNLGAHRDATEVAYWRDMSVGHLRRPTVQEDESTQNVFAGTALMLAIRDVISDGEKRSTWRVHLQGALSVFATDIELQSITDTSTRSILKRLARSLQIRSPLATPGTLPSPEEDKGKAAEMNVEVLGLPRQLSGVLKHIRALRLEKNALQNIESNSGSDNMQRLWSALRAQCLEVIVQLKNFSESVTAASTPPTSHRSPDRDRLYSYVALLQVYSGVMDLTINDSGLRTTLETAVSTLRGYHFDDGGARCDPDLVFVLFSIGCLVRSGEERTLVSSMLMRITKEHGKGNANLARLFLEELWTRVDLQNQLVKQSDVDALMTEKDWDLSLW